MRVVGLGYDAEYFTLDDHEVVHAAVPHVDPQVRAVAPVWLPHIAPTPLCGLGRGAANRQPASRRQGMLCRACHDHLRELDEWVRQAELHLSNGHASGNGQDSGSGQGTGLTVTQNPANRRHAMPF